MQLSTELCGGSTLSAFAPKAPRDRGGAEGHIAWSPVAPTVERAPREVSQRGSPNVRLRARRPRRYTPPTMKSKPWPFWVRLAFWLVFLAMVQTAANGGRFPYF